MSLYIDELNSATKQTDKKPMQERNTIPFNLISRQCVSKVAKVIEWKITPIKATMKFDLQTLVEGDRPWDHRIPDDLKIIRKN